VRGGNEHVEEQRVVVRLPAAHLERNRLAAVRARRLDAAVAKIKALTEKLAAAGASTAGDGSDSYDSSQPPAMPI